MRLALYQPDIPQNTGTLLRMAACLDLDVDIIEPCGFTFSHKGLRRAGLDYMTPDMLTRHMDFPSFQQAHSSRRLILASTRGNTPYTKFKFHKEDILMMGRESAGVPDPVFDQATATVTIPMKAGMRSLNVAISAAMIVGEMIRQTSPQDGFFCHP